MNNVIFLFVYNVFYLVNIGDINKLIYQKYLNIRNKIDQKDLEELEKNYLF